MKNAVLGQLAREREARRPKREREASCSTPPEVAASGAVHPPLATPPPPQLALRRGIDCMARRLNMVHGGWCEEQHLDDLVRFFSHSVEWKNCEHDSSRGRKMAWTGFGQPDGAALLAVDQLEWKYALRHGGLRGTITVVCKIFELLQSLHPGDAILPILVNCCRYEGEQRCLRHPHNCRQVTLSLGAPRTFSVSGAGLPLHEGGNRYDVLLQNGDAMILDGQQHEVYPDQEGGGVRFSVNLFYGTADDQRTNRRGRSTLSIQPRDVIERGWHPWACPRCGWHHEGCNGQPAWKCCLNTQLDDPSWNRGGGVVR